MFNEFSDNGYEHIIWKQQSLAQALQHELAFILVELIQAWQRNERITMLLWIKHPFRGCWIRILTINSTEWIMIWLKWLYTETAMVAFSDWVSEFLC